MYESLKILVIFLFRQHTNSVKLLLSVFGHGWPRWKWITTWKRPANVFKFCACTLQKLIMVCSPSKNSLDISLLMFQEHFVCGWRHLRTVAPIANAHIFCASRARPVRSRDSCMCSGAKNFRCIDLLFLYFASVVGLLTRKRGTWNQNEMVDLWKNPGRRSASACTTKNKHRHRLPTPSEIREVAREGRSWLDERVDEL